ncbi:GAP family protein [Promicromonospora kroppenstedtii]|uniref:GAP family protein n=1 Tax=Promicromonospora kroppenstedtii TaxID=440482 RepID=A0ABW7XND5_9MICO
MGDLLVQLAPEFIGLAMTPAAIIACFLLLGSDRPYRNVAVFGGTVVIVYAVIGAAALAAGRAAGTHQTEEPAAIRGWIGLGVGLLFLAGGVASAVPRRADRPRESGAPAPDLATRLAHPRLPTLVGIATVLALLNPNVAIFASGVSTVVTADVTRGAQAAAVGLLVLASVLDYIVPTVLHAVLGVPGRRQLGEIRQWLVRHDRPIGAVVLLVFGIVFTVRGLVRLLAGSP